MGKKKLRENCLLIDLEGGGIGREDKLTEDGKMLPGRKESLERRPPQVTSLRRGAAERRRLHLFNGPGF
ncbi:hypothetical protein SLE2022_355410 [Rubroshorea leprosula]